MKRIGLVVFMLVLSLAFSTQSYAKIDSSVNLNPTEDVCIYQGLPDTHLGSSIHLGAGLWGANYNYDSRSYLKFDLSSYTDITSATLWVWKEAGLDDNPDVSSNVTVYATETGWGEADLTWNDQKNCALGTADGTTVVTSEATWYAWDVTSLAKTAQGGAFSVALVSGDRGHNYFSSEGTYSPYLQVNAAPEPVSSALFLLGGASLAVRQIRRRKKA